MIQGVIFDMDGTLLDSMAIWQDVGVRFLHMQGLEAEEGLRERLFRMSLEEGSSYIKERYALTMTEEEIRDQVLDIVKVYYEEEAPLKPGVMMLLDSYRSEGIPMVIATTNDRSLAISALERLGILDYFDEIFTGTELQTTKHEPLIYQTAADYMQLPNAHVAVYEDVLHAIRTANAVGFYTVGVYDEESKADWETIKNEADAYICF